MTEIATSITFGSINDKSYPYRTLRRVVPANYSQHFDSIVGVTRLDESVMEHIVIKIHDIDSWGRAITKPLVSQQMRKILTPAAGFGAITLDVYPDDELYTKLLSWGKDIEVVSPANVRRNENDCGCDS